MGEGGEERPDYRLLTRNTVIRVGEIPLILRHQGRGERQVGLRG